MMVASDFLAEPITIDTDSIAVLCVENKKLYREIIASFNNGYPEEMNIVFSENFTPFKFKGNVCFISDFYNITLSSTIIKKLYEEISGFCNEDLQIETAQLKAQITAFMEKILCNYDYDFTYNEELNLVDLFKIQELKPDISTEDLLSSILDFLVVVKRYTSIKCFVLLNLHLYFTEEELAMLYDDIIYKRLPVLVLENNSNFQKASNEKIRIIDKDLCEIIEK